MQWLQAFLRSLPVRLLAVSLAGLGLLVAIIRLSGIQGTVSYRELPVVALPLPASSGERRAAELPPLPEGPPKPGAPPVEPLASLLEPGPYGALPRRASDGTSPFGAYRSATPLPDGPVIAILLTDVGLDRRSTQLAIETPPPIGLVFSAYTEATVAWLRLARWSGHETLLELPVRLVEPGLGDAGPLALGPGMPETEREDRLRRLLAKATGVFAVAMEARAFAPDPATFAPIAGSLAERGLGLVELGDNRLRDVARAAGLPYAVAMPLDAIESPEALDQAFGSLEARALEHGRALGCLRPLPLSLQRLAQWLPSLPGKGLALVPPGALFE